MPERNTSSAVAIVPLIGLFPLMFAVAAIEPNWAFPCAGAYMYWLYVRKRTQTARRIRVLRIKKRRLLVGDGLGVPLLELPLGDVLNASMESRTIHRVQENLSSGIPELRFADSRVAPGVDTARVLIEAKSGTLTLSDYFAAGFDTSEWLSRIRRFLREHGWTPAEERAERDPDAPRAPSPRLSLLDPRYRFRATRPLTKTALMLVLSTGPVLYALSWITWALHWLPPGPADVVIQALLGLSPVGLVLALVALFKDVHSHLLIRKTSVALSLAANSYWAWKIVTVANAS